MKKIRKYSFIAVLIIFLLFNGKSFAYSSSQIVLEKNDLSESSISIISNMEKDILFEVKNHLNNIYGKNYKFDNLELHIDTKENLLQDNSTVINLDVLVDMELTTKPEDMPIILELEHIIKKTHNQEKVNDVIKLRDIFLEDLNERYLKAHRVKVEYSLKKDFVNQSLRNAKLLTRFEINDNNLYLEDLYTYADKNIIRISDYLNNSTEKTMVNYEFYNRLNARDYARNHREDEPEFYRNGLSDCANFVSKSINYGGVPQDYDNKWYGSSRWGDLNTAGTWWYRTGYYMQDSGEYEGVTTYLTNMGYFYETYNNYSVFAGSILYVTDASHVALVTYGDGDTICYADHSNYKKTGEETLLNSQNYLNRCKFFMPYLNICIVK